MSKIKLIIFDYDGVIVDSFPTIHKTYYAICKKIKKECPESFEDFKKVYGLNREGFFTSRGFSQDEKVIFNELYKEEVIKHEPAFFKNIDKVIRKLKQNYKLVLISANINKEIENKLKILNVREHFDIVLGSDKSAGLRKHENMKELIEKLKLKSEEVLAIGDRVNDYFDAKEAGINNIILVEYGWGYDKNKIPEHKQAVVVHKPEDLLKAVESFEKE